MSLLAAAAIGGAISLGQSIVGGIRANKGRKEYEAQLKNLPQYEVPKEYQANQTLAKSAYQNGMPGADIARNLIYGSTAAGLSRAENYAASSTDLLGATTEMYAKEQESLNNLAYQEAQFRSQGLERLMGANLNMGAQKEKQWETNVWTPAQMKLNISQSKFSSGQNMLNTGIQNAAGTLSSYLMESNKINQMGNIFGKSTPTTSSNSNYNWTNPNVSFDTNLHNMFLNSHK